MAKTNSQKLWAKYDKARHSYLRCRIGKSPPSRTSVLVEAIRFPKGGENIQELFHEAIEESSRNPRHEDVARRLEDVLDSHERLLAGAAAAVATGHRGIEQSIMHEHASTLAKLRRHLSDTVTAALEKFIVVASQQREMLSCAVAADHSAMERLKEAEAKKSPPPHTVFNHCRGGRKRKYDHAWEVIQDADKENPRPSDKVIVNRIHKRFPMRAKVKASQIKGIRSRYGKTNKQTNKS